MLSPVLNLLVPQELVLSVKGLPRLARFLPKVVLALLVSVSAEGYKKLAIWLNDMGTLSGEVLLPTWEEGCPCPWDPHWSWGARVAPHALPRPLENYRLESAYEKHLIIKVVLVSGVHRQDRRGTTERLGGRGHGRKCRVTLPPLPAVPVCQLVSEPLLHRLLPQGHGAPQRGEALAPVAARGAGPGTRGPWALQPLPPLLHPSLLFVRPSVCPLSACHPPICLSICPSVPPQLLLVLSLSQSLERQLRAVLVPLVALRFRLLLLSLRGLLLSARAKVRAGGEPPGPRQGGQHGCAGDRAQQAEGACSEGTGVLMAWHRQRGPRQAPGAALQVSYVRRGVLGCGLWQVDVAECWRPCPGTPRG